MKYSIILMLKATPKWWIMSNDYRKTIFHQHVFPLLATYADQIHFKVFNAEPFQAQVSDFLVAETTSLDHYYLFLKEFKTTRLFTNEHFELVEVVMGAENGFSEFNEQLLEKKALNLN
jgi:hypothetical protein